MDFTTDAIAASRATQGYPFMSWTHIEDKDVKARKDHACWLCGETIDKGTTYRRRVGIGDDGPMTMHMHRECDAATRDWDQMDWEVTCFGDMDRVSRDR